MSVVFPPRNLGLGEPWWRTIDLEIVRLNNCLDLTGQSQANLHRHKDSQDTHISRQIVQLREVVNQLEENQLRITQTVSTESWSETISGNSWGNLQVVEGPPWASSAIVVAGVADITNQSPPRGGTMRRLACK